MMPTTLRNTVLFSAFLAFFLAAPVLRASETKMEVLLVWGTNDEKSSDPGHKVLDATLAAPLKKIFAWKNYFLVTSQEVGVAAQGRQKIKLSDRAEVEIIHHDKAKFEIKLYGQGKYVSKRVGEIKKGDTLTIAGDDKNDCAWFILVRQKP